MKAAVYEKFGPPEVVKIKEVETPSPKKNEILVKVHASTVSRGDSRMRGLDVPYGAVGRALARLALGIRKPRKPILGMQLSGVIEAVGNDVTLFNNGDAIFASTFPTGFGGHAEYKCLPEDTIVALKPNNMTHEEATTVPTPGMGAYSVLKRADIQDGQEVLVYGASGSVGTFAVQIAKSFGAEVTAVCSGSNHELVQSIGADHTIDYTKEDFTKLGEVYDVVFDAVDLVPSEKRKLALNEDGMYLCIAQQDGETKEDLLSLRELIEKGKIQSVIDRVYPLEEIVEAYRYVDTGHKKGNVVITMI